MPIYMGNKNMLIGGIGKVVKCDENVISLNPISEHEKQKILYGY